MSTQRVRITNASAQHIGARNANAIIIGADPYEGEYTVTPTNEVQVLETMGYTMKNNVVVEPIPKNYGLITYNGFELTVS